MTPEQQENEMLVYAMADVRVMLKAAVDAAMRHEREACAKVADARAAGLALFWPNTEQGRIAEARIIARDIRART